MRGEGEGVLVEFREEQRDARWALSGLWGVGPRLCDLKTPLKSIGWRLEPYSPYPPPKAKRGSQPHTANGGVGMASRYDRERNTFPLLAKLVWYI